MDLVEKVKKLSNEGLTKMVHKVQDLMAQSISDLENDKIQIKIDDFDRDTFNQVNEYVEEILLNEQPSKRQKTNP